VEIARRFTDSVEILAMDKLDLALARNRSVALATQPWILSLDPDESIALSALPNLHRLLDDQEAHAYTFHVNNHQKDGPPVMSLAVRLFRNDPKIRYSRPVHETVEQSLMVYAGVVVRPSHITLEHHGYLKDDAFVEGKMVRYFERNREYREEHPEDPMPWFNEAMHLLNEGREEEAASFLSRATRLDPGFLSPRSQLAYLFQERAMRLWQSLLEAMPADHPLRPQAERALGTLSAMTPPRPPVGKARSGG
jgi:tetratricopeptide (TPR) repeat protein